MSLYIKINKIVSASIYTYGIGLKALFFYFCVNEESNLPLMTLYSCLSSVE